MHRISRRFIFIGALVCIALSMLPLPGAAQQARLVRDVSVRLQLDDGPTFLFQEVYGLGIEGEVVDYKEGGVPGGTHKAPGAITYPNIVLKRPLLAGDEIWQWFDAVRQGQVSRKSAVVILINGTGDTVARYRLANAWPAKWRVRTETANQRKVFVEELELATEHTTLLE
jgi:phage tail-like protein